MYVRCYIIMKGAEPYQLLLMIWAIDRIQGKQLITTIRKFRGISRGLIKQEELLLNSIKVLFSRAVLISLYAKQNKNNKKNKNNSRTMLSVGSSF